MMTRFNNQESDRMNDIRYQIKKSVQILEDPCRPMDSETVQQRVELIRFLERLLRTEFRDTKDFREKVGKYLEGYDLRKPEPAKRIIGGRKKLRITQLELARRLGYNSHVPIAQFERGKRYPTRRVFQWLESIGM